MAHAGDQPRFTVIIPARDRADFLRQTLRTCTLQDYENLEVIVSDDGSTDNTREVVEAAARTDSRVRYITPGNGLGMRHNFEFALDQVKPGYVIALGADDGLLPYAVRGMLDTLRSTGQELLAWPAPVFSYANARTKCGQLVLHRQAGRRIVKSSEFLHRQATRLHYLSDIESPMFYVKGVTSTRLVDKVRSRSSDGRFYRCSTPDGYSGLVLAGEVETYAFSGKPFSIYGVSPTSQGMGYLASDEQAKRRSESFFRDVSQVPMHRMLAGQPYSPLITLMTADFILSLQELPGWPGRFPAIDYRSLLAKGLRELAHGLYSEDRLPRELQILNRIAEHHGLGEYFRTRVKASRRYLRKSPLEGNAVSRGLVVLDASSYGVENVFDAAYVAHYWHEIVPRLTIKSLAGTVLNSLRYVVRSRLAGEGFPPESEWDRR